MQIWPAIDIRGGKCVRLKQGDYAQETVFSDDPAAMATHWVEQGAECLHLVDLDGARDGRLVNVQSVRAILAAVRVPCELGGGVRTEYAIGQVLELGIQQIVIGTLALKEPDWFRRVCRKYPGRLALGLDARGGQVATEGWLKTSTTSAVELVQQFADEPLAAVIFTDIAADGMLAGPNLMALRQIRRALRQPLVASGGVSTIDDVRRLAELGADGCIIGRALYEGTIALPDAIRAGRNE